MSLDWMSVDWIGIMRVAGPFVGPLGAALVAVWQFRKVRKQQADENRKERHRRTIEINIQLAGPVFKAKRDAVEAMFKPGQWPDLPIPLAFIDQEFAKSTDLESNLTTMLGFLETLAVPVFAGAADERMTFELYGGTTVWYATAFRDYIIRKQKQLDRPDLYIYLLHLAERWKQWIEKEKGLHPFYLRNPSLDMDG